MGKGHARNEDTYLNKGGTNEVTAAQLKNIVTTTLKTEQYVKDILNIDEEWTITHSSDTSFKRIIQIHRDLLDIDNSLDFDTIDKPNFTQEDDDKTDFVDDALQLKGLGVDAYTKLLLHCNGDDGSHVFIDNSPSAHTVNVFGSTELDTAQKKFGSASGLFDGTGNQYLTCDAHSDFTFGNNSFTVDGWFYANGVSPHKFIFGGTEDHRWAIMYDHPTTALKAYLSFDGSSWVGITTSPISFTLNVWHHIAFSWDGTRYRIFFDGIEVSYLNSTTPLYSGVNTGFRLGSFSIIAGPWNGWVDEVRVSKGICRWASNFTPPTEEYAVYDDTQFWYVHTNLNQIDTSLWDKINKLTFTQTTPIGTDLRYLLSVDGRVTWKKWNGAAWEEVLLSNISTGNTKTELEALLYTEFVSLFPTSTLDIAVGLKTTDITTTPILDHIRIDYALIGKTLCKSDDFNVVILSETQTYLKNISGIIITSCRVQIAL